MVAAVKWEDGFGTPTTLLSTDLNSLANDTMSAASAEYDNGTNLNTLAWFELVLGSLTPTGTPRVDLYMTKELDGANYEDAPLTGGANQGHLFLGSFPLTTSTSAKRISIGPFLLPPCAIKFYLDNQSNVALAASGNTLKMGVDNYESQ